ncbi:MAG: LysM domain-containing protein [Candidatus Promineifilaceae bacterium]|nr:LysM domain-containing protein [Candidatus Promineifilaceae bacterium]
MLGIRIKPLPHPESPGRAARKQWRWILWIVVLNAWGWTVIQPATLLAQQDPTSTPDAEGNIFIVVQPNDSLWSIAARAGLSVQELLDLNGIDESHVLQPGDLLLVGQGSPPATPTSDIPTPTLPPPTSTSTPIPIRTAICLTAYEDLNQNGQLDPGEPLRADVAFTVFNNQTVVTNYISDGISEPYCIEGLEPGTYHITRSIARDETLTTAGDWAMELIHGSELSLAFGSYNQAVELGIVTPDNDAEFATRIAPTPSVTPPATDAREGTPFGGDPLIIVLLGIGIIALLLGIAVLVFWFAYDRNKNK